jgi:hypothetical protein
MKSCIESKSTYRLILVIRCAVTECPRYDVHFDDREERSGGIGFKQ